MSHDGGDSVKESLSFMFPKDTTMSMRQMKLHESLIVEGRKAADHKVQGWTEGCRAGWWQEDDPAGTVVTWPCDSFKTQVPKWLLDDGRVGRMTLTYAVHILEFDIRIVRAV